jgi:hypothetical protein
MQSINECNKERFTVLGVETVDQAADVGSTEISAVTRKRFSMASGLAGWETRDPARSMPSDDGARRHVGRSVQASGNDADVDTSHFAWQCEACSQSHVRAAVQLAPSSDEVGHQFVIASPR